MKNSRLTNQNESVMIAVWNLNGLDAERNDMKKQVNLWLPSEDVEALDRLASKQQRSRSNLVRIILGEFVRQHEGDKVVEEAGNGTTGNSLCTGDHI